MNDYARDLPRKISKDRNKSSLLPKRKRHRTCLGVPPVPCLGFVLLPARGAVQGPWLCPLLVLCLFVWALRVFVCIGTVSCCVPWFDPFGAVPVANLGARQDEGTRCLNPCSGIGNGRAKQRTARVGRGLQRASGASSCGEGAWARRAGRSHRETLRRWGLGRVPAEAVPATDGSHCRSVSLHRDEITPPYRHTYTRADV